MEKQRLKLRFQDVDPKTLSANFAAVEKRLSELAGTGAKAERVRESETSMDLGQTLVVVFGTPAAVAVAKGIYEFLKRWPNKLIIETSGGTIFAAGDAATEIAKIEQTIGIERKERT